MSKEKNMRNVHYIPGIKELTIDMWLEGKPDWEINKAIRNYLYKNRRTKANQKS